MKMVQNAMSWAENRTTQAAVSCATYEAGWDKGVALRGGRHIAHHRLG